MGTLATGIRWVLELFYTWTGNYGVAIIMLTILVRLVLFPLFQKQLTASAQMRKLNPFLKEIQEKYKDQPEEYQKKTMELYQKHKVNPLGGCLPTLVQFPVMIALYNVLMKQISTAQAASFLWVADLSKPDPYVLPILVGISSFGQAKTMAMDQDPNSKTKMWMMPIFMMFMSYRFAAGLALYWTVFNLFSMTQQFLFNKAWEKKELQEEGQKEGKNSGKDRKNRKDS
jgi:YidC/Oxa1 family membrane protein insertase